MKVQTKLWKSWSGASYERKFVFFIDLATIAMITEKTLPVDDKRLMLIKSKKNTDPKS